MKKIISIITIVTMLLSFAACGTDSLNDNSGNKKDNNFFFEAEKETEPILFWVNFNTNGGTKVDSIKTLLLTEAPITQKDNYVFDGWYLDEKLTQAAIFPMEITYSRTLYAKWLKIKDTALLKDTKIRLWDNYSPVVTANISPNGFDMQELIKEGYYMTISVDYTVSYRKDYDIPFDIGYLGAPEYEVYLYNSKKQGISKEEIKATKSSKQNSIQLTQTVNAINQESWTLEFSTDNMQNVIYIEDIIITYTCHK